tara:strand:+ start:196 stop:774 length:579 start_codon:yes stop_codon:yes gene_type:complete
MSDEEENVDIYQDLENDVQEEINDEINNNVEDNSEFVESDDDEEESIFVKPDPKPVKKKRELSAEHKEKLRQGRLKALENRRKNAQQKREMKELQKKKKDLEYESLKKDVEKYDNPALNGFNENLQKTWNLSEEQLIDLQEKAVEKYDTKRKARKQEKKKKQQELEHTQKVKKVIHNTTSTLDNAWSYYIPQ